MSDQYGCWEPGLLHDRVHTDLPLSEGPIARLTRERAELAEALREAMMDLDHMLLAYPNDPAVWFDDVRHAQSRMRERLARIEGKS